MRILLFNEIPRTIKVSEAMFSSPRWGFLYLILIITAIEVAVVTVLVLSLGISLFNNTQW